MNRTIEQWQEVVGSGQHTSVLGYAVQDMQELARQRDELRSMLEVMTELCAIKYGNLDDDVFAEICKSRELLQSIKEQTK